MLTSKFLRHSFYAILAFSSGIQCNGKKVKSAQRPNFIIIQLDDLGIDDIGLHGNKFVETPNIDELGAQSLQFERFYVNPVSAPSRASLLTGRDFLRTGVSHVHGGKDFMNLEEITIAQVLQKQGYITGMWGKWHVGNTNGYFPWQRGFDEAFMSDLYKHKNNSGMYNGKPFNTNKWSDEVITDFAINFIESHKETSFFAYLSYLTCHSPIEAKDSLIEKYMQKGLSKPLATLYAMIEQTDYQIGRLMKALHNAGLDNNTVVVFLSDNGPAIEKTFFSDKDRSIRYVQHLKGHKGDLWENGVRSPLFVLWRGIIKPGKSAALTYITDIFPTISELATSNIAPSNKIDGLSLTKYFDNPNKKEDSRNLYNYAHKAWLPGKQPYTPEGVYMEYNPVSKDTVNCENQVLSVISGYYKLLINANTNTCEKNHEIIELFNLRNDPKETLNLASQNPELVNSLYKKICLWFNGIKENTNSFQMPVFIINKTDDSCIVKANAPSQISESLKNTVHYLSGWKNKGDSCQYDISVLQKGNYSVKINYELNNINSAIVRLSIGGVNKDFILNSKKRYTNYEHFQINAGLGRISLKVLNDCHNGNLKIYTIIVKSIEVKGKSISCLQM